MAALLFMSARPILGDFLPIFDGFSPKLPGITNFSLKIVNFLLFWILLCLSGSKFCPGATFNFRPILADFHEYTLNIASYHAIEAINDYF